MLSSGPCSDAERAAQSQRERLYGAMVACCTAQGYEHTAVAELIQLAGLSRRDFYKHFDDLEDCFLATLDEILGAVRAVVSARLRRSGSWEEQGLAALKGFLELLVAQPAATRLCLVESYTVGDPAIAKVDRATDAFKALARDTFAQRPGHTGLPEEITDAMIGGLRKMIHSCLHRGTENSLVEYSQILFDLALGYQPPPKHLRGRPRRRGRGTAAQRAPSDWARQSDADDPAERIIRTTMEGVARNGYRGLTIAEIAEGSEVSLSTFYAHFDNKGQALEAALYSGRTRLAGVAMPAIKRARSWPEAIREMIAAICAFLASEPEFASLLTSAALGAGSKAVEQHELALKAVRRPLNEGRELLRPELSPIELEAITLICYSLICEWIQHRGVESLPRVTPLASYLALAPFIGAEDACCVANGGRYRVSEELPA